MIIERDVGIATDDGTILRADVFRPEGPQPAAIIMTYGPYGKGLAWKESHKGSWEWMEEKHPDWLPGSTKSHMTWETVDPETWVPWGYAIIRVDSRGQGRTPGTLNPFSQREVQDYYDAIEWAGTQPWSNGKVGLVGISYYAMNQWQVAARQPPHLAAMIPWEGAADFYRDASRHGGILSNAFSVGWFNNSVVPVQNGNASRYGVSATGPERYDEETLKKNRIAPLDKYLQHPLDDEAYRSLTPDWSKVVVPLLSCANLGGFGLHARGNYEGFTQAASPQKWLEGHPGKHEEWFYLEEGVQLQRKFLDHFLKQIDNGWDSTPRVLMRQRFPFSDRWEWRKDQRWPLTNTQWTSLSLSAQGSQLRVKLPEEASSLTFDALGTPATFTSGPLQQDIELIGPLAATLHISSSTTDADLFVTLRAFAPDNREVWFPGASEPRVPLAQGWLRASHRKLDAVKSRKYRPYHSHDELWPLEPGKVYEVEIELWPTCVALPAGYRLALQVGGKDFAREEVNPTAAGWVTAGSGPFRHTHPIDRPESIFGGRTTIHTGGELTQSSLLLPVIGEEVKVLLSE